MRMILAVIVVLVALANPNRSPAMREISLAYNMENAKNGVVRPLLEITKHGYGDEASDTTSCATPTLPLARVAFLFDRSHKAVID